MANMVVEIHKIVLSAYNLSISEFFSPEYDGQCPKIGDCVIKVTKNTSIQIQDGYRPPSGKFLIAISPHPIHFVFASGVAW